MLTSPGSTCARLTQELVAKSEALQEDLEMARELQSALLPQRFPRFPHDATKQESAFTIITSYPER